MSELQETNPIEPMKETRPIEPTQTTKAISSTKVRGLITIVIVIAVALAAILIVWSYKKTSAPVNEVGKEETPTKSEEGKNEVSIKPETLAAANIEIYDVAEQPLSSFLRVTGSVEANQQQLQQIVAPVSGRAEKVKVVLGENVKAGSTLAYIASPQIAQMRGKMHEAETKLDLTKRNLQRVEMAENRVAVVSAKAKLDEAEASLRRVKKLAELGAGAGKDLIAAEAAHQTAKAEYDFQSNIALNRERLQAVADVETAKVELHHIQSEMKAYGVPSPEAEHNEQKGDTSLIPLVSPISGTVIERTVNSGASIESGKSIFTIANLSSIWIIANVPETQLSQINIGTKAEVKTSIPGQEKLIGTVAYIDPRLKEETRTAQVRIDLANPGNKLNLGMFVEINFLVTNPTTTTTIIAVPEDAVQRIGERTIVFVPKGDKEGHFEVRDVQLGGETAAGYHRVISGVEKGEKVVSKGSFALKTQLMKGELGEE